MTRYEAGLEGHSNAIQNNVKLQLFINYLLQLLDAERKKAWKLDIGVRSRVCFLMGGWTTPCLKAARTQPANHQRGINQIHNTGPNGREHFFKEAVRNAVRWAVRLLQFLYYIS